MVTSVPSLHTTGPQHQEWASAPSLWPTARGGHHSLFSNSSVQKRAFFVFAAFPQAIPSAPSAIYPPAAPCLVVSAPLFRCHRPRPSTLEPSGKRPPTSHEGRADGGACPQYWASIGRVAGRGGASAWVLGHLVSSQGIPCGSHSGFGYHYGTAVTPDPAACLRSGTHRTPKRGSSRTPSRVSPAPGETRRLLPLSSGTSPSPEVPGPSPLFLAVRPLLKAAVSPLYAEDDESCFARAEGRI